MLREMSKLPRNVHFVGSIALDSVDEVFREVGATCGRRLRRLPDGEPGGRRLWVSWQWPLLRASAYLRETPDRSPGSPTPTLELVPGTDPGAVTFGELGYAREARISYQDFCAARDRGEIADHVTFQVCLPTPFAVISSFLDPESARAVTPAYERAMFQDVARICDAIPHHDLAIQWDVCREMLIWDGQLAMHDQIPGAIESIKTSLTRCLDAVPADADLGIHLCYGDYDARHFVEPQDAANEVDLANTLATLTDRTLTYVHMPVPKDRVDAAFYEPLRRLELPAATELFLGLIHADGNDDERIRVASEFVADFGISTECGIARQRTPEQVKALIHAHAAASAEPAPGVAAKS
jgi:hypothetical protein